MNQIEIGMLPPILSVQIEQTRRLIIERAWQSSNWSTTLLEFYKLKLCAIGAYFLCQLCAFELCVYSKDANQRFIR